MDTRTATGQNDPTRRTTWAHLVTCALRGTHHEYEDRCGFSEQLAWVVDGATPLAEPFRVAGRSSAAWLADKIDGAMRAIATCETTDTANILGVHRTVKQSIDALAPRSVQSPSASLALALIDGNTVRIEVIGDVLALCYLADGTIVSVESGLPRLTARVDGKKTRWTDITNTMLQREVILKRRYTLAAGLPDPRAIGRASVPIRELDRLVMLSDGAVSLVESSEWQVGSWYSAVMSRAARAATTLDYRDDLTFLAVSPSGPS